MQLCASMLLRALYMLSLSSHVFGYSADVVKNLTKYLFETNAYDNTLRPSTDQSLATELKVSFHLMGINKLDELEEKLVTTAYLTLKWRDEFLTWDPSAFPVYRLMLPQTLVWKPDLVLKNGFTEFKELGGSFYNILLALSGDVIWKPYQVFQSQCSIDVTYFPFDTQTCDIVFTLWSHYSSQVNLTSAKDAVARDQYQSNSIWEIVSTNQNIDNSGSNAVITYSLNLKRKPSHFVGNIVLPILFLGILNILVFVIPADAGEKMSYSITVALGFMVFLTIISSELPANSDTTPYLTSYLQIQIIMGGIALIVSSLQLRLRHKEEGQNVNGFFQLIVKLSHCQLRKNKVMKGKTVIPLDDVKEKNFADDEDDVKMSWNDVTSAIDFLMFGIYSLVYLISTVCVVSLMENGT
ncbi:neuronal acetylcholine receptor subunit beta-2-like [Ostrea edulis]|uniref:neuronal acetylcholine receptor subunit beta-2-like n=1 Tax=Ostrea edulis TaxID=37623 RepID=UPI0024AFFC2A|nr:neuronal acetylcholine receptor subunit beta-2-like [Ostrea edulis]